MANQNDSKILELKKKIKEKKMKLKKTSKFTPITNCSLEIDGVRHNLNVCEKLQLQRLAVILNMYKKSSEELEFEDFIISGFPVVAWLQDVMSKLEVVSRKDEEIKLKKMEEKLDELLSNEKRVELELDSIADMLSE